MAYAKSEKRQPKQETDEEILQYARDGLKSCIDEEATERAKMKDDLRFATLDQWPSDIRAERENDKENGPRPCLTIDQYSQYRTQVVNDARQGKPGINVRPQDEGGDIETAKILKGLIRNIEDQSNADIAYTAAIGSAVDIGLGYFRITTEYVSDESFDQELFIRPIPNTFSVYLGKHYLPDGSDADRGYVVESMPIETFKKMFPKAKTEKQDFEGLDPAIVGLWKTEETITVVEEYCIKRHAQVLHFLADGTTITDADYQAWPKEAGARPTIMDTRTTVKKELKWRKLTAVEVLDKRDLPGQYIPIVEVVGREAWIDGRRVVWGLVRPVKDSLRQYNYFASAVTERMGLSPKAPWIIAEGQVEGHEAKWKTANRVNHAYLPYKAIDTNGAIVPPPQRIGPPPVEAALLQHMEVIQRDVRASLGMYKAAVGESESQQSGRAILALQRESDTSTYHFGANLGVSIRHAGRILVDLIPHYYDTKRIVRILGEDGEVKTATLDPQLEVPYQQTSAGAVFNPGMGKYDVSISVGPSYNTKRMEAQATFVEMAKGAADPMSAALLRYLTVKNSDFEGSQEAAKAMRALLPPPVQEALSGKLPPEVQGIVAQAQMQIQALQKELQEEQAGTKAAALKTQADHDAKMKQLQLDGVIEAEKAKLAREKAEAEFALEKWKAEQKAALEAATCAAKQALTEREAQFEAGQSERKMKAEQEQRAFDNEMKVKESNEKDAAKVMPALEQLMTQMVQTLQTMAEGQKRMEQTQEAMLAEAKKPKQVSLGSVQRGANGQVSGATVRVH